MLGMRWRCLFHASLCDSLTTRACVQSRKVAQPGWEHDDSASDSSDSSFERVRNTDWNNIDQQTRGHLADRVWAWQDARENDLQQRAQAQVSVSRSEQGSGPREASLPGCVTVVHITWSRPVNVTTEMARHPDY